MRRYKVVIGRTLRARTLPTQKTEAKIGCKVLNVMTRPRYANILPHRFNQRKGPISIENGVLHQRYVAQLLCRYFPTAPRRVSALRSSAPFSSSDISGKNASTTPCRPTTLGSDSATP